MKKHEIIDLYLELESGRHGSAMVKEIVNRAMNNGEWLDGFHLAVKHGELDIEERTELLSVIHEEYPDAMTEKNQLIKLIYRSLPNAEGAVDFRWIIDLDGAVFAADGLHVAKFKNLELVWITPRIAWDGIEFEKLTKDHLVGTWYDLSDGLMPWKPLKICVKTGKIVEGQVIQF